MKRYKGYYIDNNVFHSESEIDKFIENKTMELFISACKMFLKNPCMEVAHYCSELSEKLVEKYGYTLDELEDIEIDVITKAEV